MTPIEALATLLGIVNIVLLVRRSIWNYPFGLAMVALYAHIFLREKLYSDAILQIFFFLIQLYGWWAWTRAGGGTGGQVRVARMTAPARGMWLVGIALLSLAWGSMMGRVTDAAFPLWDAGVAVTSIAAQILLARRRIENWVLWIAVDVLAIGLYATKGLALTAGLYALFLILSVAGLIEWRRAELRGA